MNDINYRGTFDFSIRKDAKLLWRGETIAVSDFHIGNTISITFSGEIQETNPAHILNVTRTQLLDDEK